MNKGTSDMIDGALAGQRIAKAMITPTSDGRIGGSLKNGAIVLASKLAAGQRAGMIVLALIPGNRATPFATWWMRDDGETFGGDYVTTIQAGLKSFTERRS